MSGIARIRAVFEKAKAEGRGALVAYLMGGDPDLARSEEYVRALAAGGADLIEVGVPFSDPVADGPTIQAASVRALRSGVHPRGVLDMVRRLRDDSVTTPLVTMTYANIPFTMGYDAYATALFEAGVDGTIIPDIPVDEAGPLGAAMEARGLAQVLLAAPLSVGARLQRIAAASRGFLYLVGTFGTTGARTDLAAETLSLLDAVVPVARAADVPLAVGFGVSGPEQVRALVAHGANGVVVGSALVRLVEDRRPPEDVAAMVRRLTEGLRA